MGANLVRLANTRWARRFCARPDPGDRDVPEPSAGLRASDPVPAQPHRRRPLRLRGTHVPVSHHHREGTELPPRRPQERGVPGVEGPRDGQGGDDRMPLLRQCGERCRLPRFPARVQVQDHLPAHGRRVGAGGGVLQPQRDPHAPGRGFSHPADDSLCGRDRRRLRDAPGCREEVELDGRNLPTGRRLPLSEQFSKLRREGLQVTGCGRSRRVLRCARSTWTANRSAARWSSTCARA